MSAGAAPPRALRRLADTVTRAALVATALLCAGCSSLPFFGDEAKKDADGKVEEPQVALYEFDVRAPGALRTLLVDYLDISRFQRGPKSEAITDAELDRLAAAAPAQARGLLETEGYFDSEVKVEQSRTATGMTRLEMTVVPGPRVLVTSVDISSAVPLPPRLPTRDEPATDRLAAARGNWQLPAGQPFRSQAWSSAKTQALGGFRSGGYPKAEWQSTNARVDATALSAALTLVVEPGPRYRIGEIRVEGINRYDEKAVRRLAEFRHGDEYSEQKLLDLQDRIVKSGLFEGASVELDTDAPPEGAPVVVKVKELTQHQATFGVGYSANTGPRVSVEHYDRRLFGLQFISHSTLIFGPNQKLIGTELTSYPKAGGWRNLIAANAEQLDAASETRDSFTARIGRSKDTTEFERLYYLEGVRAALTNSKLDTDARAASVNYHWLRRELDNILLPTRGTALSLQGGAGYGSGTLRRSDVDGEYSSRGPFLRTYARFNAYRPFGSWFGNARVEAGEVFVRNLIAVPDTILFRAGGDNSVRGYGYRTLGPEINRAVVGGRVLLTGSVEMEHPILDRLPALLGAVFVDAGNAADKWREMKPEVGVGVGVHYRSPVGPLRLDVAYGESTQKVRLHLSVGVVF